MKAWIGQGEAGHLVEADDAVVSVFDHGFTVGDGIFETMRSQNGRVFLWPWHLERLHSSAHILGLRVPGDALLSEVLRAVVQANAAEGSARVRLTISAGAGPLGSARDASAPTVVCATAPVPERHGPAVLHVAPWPRNERSPLAGAKSTSYAENVVALAAAQAAGASEAVFANTAGNLCEGTGSNIFIVRDGRALTPPVSAGPLPGVTRRFVLGLGDASVPVEEAAITMAEFEQADEVFLTSTFQDVRAVTQVGSKRWEVGPVTAELARRFAARASETWCWT